MFRRLQNDHEEEAAVRARASRPAARGSPSCIRRCFCLQGAPEGAAPAEAPPRRDWAQARTLRPYRFVPSAEAYEAGPPPRFSRWLEMGGAELEPLLRCTTLIDCHWLLKFARREVRETPDTASHSAPCRTHGRVQPLPTHTGPAGAQWCRAGVAAAAADIEIAPDWNFTYGGDVCDKGGAIGGTMRVVKSLVKLKKKYPERVTLLLGNRDLNKLRLTSELAPSQLRPGARKTIPGPYWIPPAKTVSPQLYLARIIAKTKGVNENQVTDAEIAAADTLPARIKWMLKETMGADGEFERRAAELGEIAGRPASDDEAAASFVESMGPGGFMREFLELGQLSHIIGGTMYVHGGLMSSGYGAGLGRDAVGQKPTDCYGYVPGAAGRMSDVHAWVKALNEWYAAELSDWRKRPEWEAATAEAYAAGRRGGHRLMDYVLPNSEPSVVVGRHLDGKGMPAHIPKPILRSLNAGGITRLVVGHTPHGNCPTVIKSGSAAQGGAFVETIMADTSYSDMSKPDNRGAAFSSVHLMGDGTTRVKGVLQDGRPISYELAPGVGPPAELVGLEEPAEPAEHSPHPVPAEAQQPRYFVKAALASGELLMCHVSGFKVLYETVDEEQAASRVNAPGAKPPGIQRTLTTTGDADVLGQRADFATARSELALALFKSADLDSSGTLSASELAQAIAKSEWKEQFFKLVGNASLAKATNDELLAAIDTGRSGDISLAEFQAFVGGEAGGEAAAGAARRGGGGGCLGGELGWVVPALLGAAVAVFVMKVIK